MHHLLALVLALFLAGPGDEQFIDQVLERATQGLKRNHSPGELKSHRKGYALEDEVARVLQPHLKDGWYTSIEVARSGQGVFISHIGKRSNPRDYHQSAITEFDIVKVRSGVQLREGAPLVPADIEGVWELKTGMMKPHQHIKQSRLLGKPPTVIRVDVQRVLSGSPRSFYRVAMDPVNERLPDQRVSMERPVEPLRAPVLESTMKPVTVNEAKVATAKKVRGSFLGAYVLQSGLDAAVFGDGATFRESMQEIASTRFVGQAATFVLVSQQVNRGLRSVRIAPLLGGMPRPLGNLVRGAAPMAVAMVAADGLFGERDVPGAMVSVMTITAAEATVGRLLLPLVQAVPSSRLAMNAVETVRMGLVLFTATSLERGAAAVVGRKDLRRISIRQVPQ